ncbi:YfbM family protein [Allokutzneria sp. NRRL B-24872]|uniref:YfbM family protein n=1 Tax=Allokutzneria sp. NRRL B-24872 TaxID=1137961 RepID=UPI000A3A1BA7|nr:YfbM family protein [Allokutzneria sp. NRRL B-24872]
MACRGYFLALDEPRIALVLAQDGDDEGLIEVITELDAPDECGVDKAWDGIHRCLTEGRLGSEDGTYPLNAVVLGGLPLYQGDDYVISYNTPAEVREVADALTELDLQPFTAKYWALDPDEYGAVVDEGGLTYLTQYLREITAFYQRAAKAGWASLFVADQ